MSVKGYSALMNAVNSPGCSAVLFGVKSLAEYCSPIGLLSFAVTREKAQVVLFW